MSELVLYTHFKEADSIIDPLINKFKESNEYNLIDNKQLVLITYNNAENPLFKVNDVCTLLNKKNIRQVIVEDQTKPIHERIYTQDKDFVYGLCNSSDNSVRRTLFFTRRGFYIYLMTSRGDISNIFRNFLLIILEELHEKGLITKENALMLTKERHGEEIAKIEMRLQEINNKLIAERESRQHIEEKLDTISYENLTYKKRIETVYEYHENMLSDFPDTKETELQLLKKLYMKPLYVYINAYSPKITKTPKEKSVSKIHSYLSSEDIKRLNLEESEDDFTPPQLHFVPQIKVENFKLNAPPPLDDEFYYSLSLSKKPTKHLVHISYVINKEHYENVLQFLNKNCKIEDDIFLVSLNEIENKIQELLIKIGNSQLNSNSQLNKKL